MMRRIEDGLDFLMYNNKHLKGVLGKNTNLKESLEVYLNNMDDFLCSIDSPQNYERLIGYLKTNYVIQHIPDSYIKFGKGYIKELGYYYNFSNHKINLSDEEYRIVLQCIQNEQLDSLVPWAEFLCNKKKDYPMWFRYYIFNKVVKTGRTYDTIEEMSRRNSSTTAPYIECNYDVIDDIYNALSNYISFEGVMGRMDGFNFKDEYFKAKKKSNSSGKAK